MDPRQFKELVMKLQEEKEREVMAHNQSKKELELKSAELIKEQRANEDLRTNCARLEGADSSGKQKIQELERQIHDLNKTSITKDHEIQNLNAKTRDSKICPPLIPSWS